MNISNNHTDLSCINENNPLMYMVGKHLNAIILLKLEALVGVYDTQGMNVQLVPPLTSLIGKISLF